MTRTIRVALTQGKYALIDERDRHRVERFQWFAAANHERGWYAARHAVGGSRRLIRMHNAILSPLPAGRLVDHINRDGLDNRRGNLRLATPSQNASNRTHWGASGLKGVFRRPSGRFRSAIRIGGHLQNLGTFDSATDAGRAYDRAARRAFGEFAFLNFPEVR